MRISFCYVHGISNIDTPFFDSLDDQTFFFERHEVGYIDTTFYPPHYRNSIRISSEDFDFNSEVNYVRFEYLNKWYYYFIDSVEYINENLMEVNITMDYIQTYMFNIEIDSGIIERKHINRWTENNLINRNYIRENVGNGEYIYGDKVNMSFVNDTDLWIVAKISSMASPDGMSTGNFTTTIKCGALETTIGYGIAIGNIKCSKYRFIDVNSQQPPEEDDLDVLGWLLTRNETVDVTILPYNPCPSIFSRDGDFLVINNTLYPNTIKKINRRFAPAVVVYESYYGTILGSSYKQYLTVDDKYGSLPIDNFIKDTAIETPFTYRYVPALLDVNYMKFVFGSESTLIEYPLHLLSKNLIYYTCRFDCDSGSQIFALQEDAALRNRCYTIDIDVDKCTTDLVNSAWANYLANNRSRLLTTTISATAVAADVAIGIGTNNAFAKADLNNITSDVRSWDKRYKKDAYSHMPLKKDATDRYYSVLAKRDERNARTIAEAGSQGLHALTDIANDAINNMAKPSSSKAVGSYEAYLYSNRIRIFTQLSKVENFIQCANYYHRNGYKVDEYINNLTDDVFHYFNNRYYFNICKFSTANVHLHGCIEDEETIDGITNRLLTGIRLWNIAPFYDMLQDRFPIGTYQYDNVEIDYL